MGARKTTDTIEAFAEKATYIYTHETYFLKGKVYEAK